MDLGTRATDEDVAKLVQVIHSSDDSWTRRSATRILGQFCWTQSGCATLHAEEGSIVTRARTSVSA